MKKEMRLIDANKLIEDLEAAKDHGGMGACVAGTLIRYIKRCATVDAVEVVHGHWTSLTECSNAGVYCSVCNKKVYKEDYAWCNRKNKLRSNYCPNCGAKMDGERKDNGNNI